MDTIKIIIIAALSLFGGISSAPPLRERSYEFDNFEEIIPLYRLGNAVIPGLYQVELQPILDEGYGTRFTAPGKVWINVVCSLATSNITLHALTLNISESSVKVTDFPGGNEVAIASFDVDPEKDFFIINLEQDLRPGGIYRIYIEYVAPVSRQVLYGLYLSNYTADDGTTRYMAVTDLEATDARRVFPSFDEPQMKAEYEISIIRLPKYHSLSNMDLLRTETAGPGLPTGWVKDVYKRTEKMSTYLFCIAVSDFEMEEAEAGHYSKPVKVWGPPPYMQRGAGSYSPTITAKLMAALENYFQIPYTFPKMDKISVPHFGSGAMENWGLNTYRLNRLLIEDGVATAADRISTVITLSHELVHQWFGNLVTMSWWDDLWLNEGFASYYSNVVMPEIGFEDMLPLDTMVSDAVQRAMYYDVTSATHPIHHTVTTPTEIRIMFDTITYSKGCAIVRMTESILTEPVMKSGLTAFLTKFKHANAHQDDLFQSLQEEVDLLPGPSILPADTTVKDVLDSWTLNSGLPVLKAARTGGSPSITLQQETLRVNFDDASDGTTWHIPIAVQLPTDTLVDATPKHWLTKDQPLTFYTVGNAEWYILNPRQVGYYRVRYDTASLQAIVEQLYTDHTVFDPQTRSALIDDNLVLGYAGYLPIQDALNLTMYLRNERHLTPWTSFVTNMAKPYRFFARNAGLPAFKRYVLGLLKDTLTEIGLDPQPNESIGNATILRNRLFEWACNLGDADCIQYSKTKFAEWSLDPTNNTIIFPDLRPLVYCTAVANGGDKEWNFAFAQYRVADREVAKTNLIRSLGCSKSHIRLSRLLDLATTLNSGVDADHRVLALQAVAGNSVGADLAFNYIRNNFETIRRRFGVSMISNVITTLSNTLNKVFDITDLQKFIQANSAALQPVSGALQSAITNIENNIKWMSRNDPAFRDFIERLP